jgi:hypothetical protein
VVIQSKALQRKGKLNKSRYAKQNGIHQDINDIGISYLFWQNSCHLLAGAFLKNEISLQARITSNGNRKRMFSPIRIKLFVSPCV